jgi:hypothetical protein
MRVSDFCFVSAVVAILCGMALGIWMGIGQDFTLAPAHAHLNLLGWVTMAIMGFYHRGTEAARPRLAWIQVTTGAVGFWVFPVGLGFYLATGDKVYKPLLMIGSFFAFASMLLFAAIVFLDIRIHARPVARLHPESG